MTPTARLRSWLDDRLAAGRLLELGRHKTVPVHRASAIYYLGGMTLFLFVVQVLTGVLLMLYYRPSADEAFESVEFIMTSVRFGWLIRSIHAWSANLMVWFAFAHLATVYFAKAYRPPRELTWMAGVGLLFLSLAFGFSGYLLPWNQISFFATKVGADVAGTLPLVGEGLARFLRGGERVTGATLSRFYGWHVGILPVLTMALLAVHLLLVQKEGMSVPPALADEARRRRPQRFFPDYLLREVTGWTAALAGVAALAAFLPWELGEKADPFAAAPADIRPEWYFMFLFQTLKVFPGGHVLGVPLEVVPILLSIVAALVLLLVPFLDRGVVRRGRSPGFTALGAVGLVYVVAMTAWGYHSWVPVWVVLGGAALLALLAFGVRHGR